MIRIYRITQRAVRAVTVAALGTVLVAGLEAAPSLKTSASAQGLLSIGRDDDFDADISYFGASYSYSEVEFESSLGIGTVVDGLHEVPVSYVHGEVERDGLDIAKEFGVDLPGLFFGDSTMLAVFGLSLANGSLSNSGVAQVGANGVMQIGLTFLEEDNLFGTGLSSDFIGDELIGSTHFRNDWLLGRAGLREVYAPQGASGPHYYVGGAFAYENYDQSFSAHASIRRGGVPIVMQELHGTATDDYYGIELTAGIGIPVADGFSVSIEGYAIPSYHTTEVRLMQVTDFAGGITQTMESSDNEFALSGGVRASAKYSLTDALTLGVSYEYSVLDDVGQVHVPANPDEQPGMFGSGSVERHFVRGELNFDTGVLYSSDARLKRDVASLGQLSNGLQLYRYRYLWSDTPYVGVMAQEVAARYPAAVVRGKDGYLRVNYARLGLDMQTWSGWLASGERHWLSRTGPHKPTSGDRTSL